ILARRELWEFPRSIELASLVALGAIVFAGVLLAGGGRRLADDLRQILPAGGRPQGELVEGDPAL
ncbi:MAG: hypothetical protein ACREEW_06120, partial [Caulobacteraceae bacterium]